MINSLIAIIILAVLIILWLVSLLHKQDLVSISRSKIAELIDYLREEEGDTVEIYHDNADYGDNNSLVICRGTWVNGSLETFYGDSLLDCLKQAATKRLAAKLDAK